jgi:hypothetical protein
MNSVNSDPTVISAMDATVVLQAENGTSFNAQQRISLLIPPSIKAFAPSEAYLQFDFTMNTPIATAEGEGYTSGTDAMFQLNPFIGIHSVIRDCFLYDGNGREIDSTRNYDVNAMCHLPWSLGSDESAIKSSQEGQGVWLSRPNQLPSNMDVENLTKSSYASNLYYNSPNFNGTNDFNTDTTLNIPSVRVQRFTFPLSALGFFNSSTVFPNVLCNGLRLDLLLQSQQKSCFPIYGGNGVAIEGALDLANTTLTFTAPATRPFPHNSYWDLFFRGLCVGTRIELSDTVSTQTGRITSIELNHDGGAVINLVPDLAPVAVGTYAITRVLPNQFPNWEINNVQMFVRETMMSQASAESLRGGATYTWVSHYNVPQSLPPNAVNPTISWNVLPINQALGLVVAPYDESYNGSSSLNMLNYPYGNTKWLFGLETIDVPALTQSTKVEGYQWQIGTELQPSQPDLTFYKCVPQYANYEVKNYFNALGKSVYSFQLHSLESDKDLTEGLMTSVWTPHRQFTLALAPSPSQVLSLVDKPIQLRLSTANGESLSDQYTFHLFIAHYRTAVLGTEMGTQIQM